MAAIKADKPGAVPTAWPGPNAGEGANDGGPIGPGVALARAPWLTLWPLPAVLGWGLAWAAFLGSLQLGWIAPIAFAAAVVASALPLGLGLAKGWRRQAWVLGGFPLSLLATGWVASTLPTWVWLMPLAALWLAYPLQAWRDAPVFPTPAGALTGLDDVIELSSGDRVLDAGCGLGHGLEALRSVFPRVELEGVESSWMLRLACARRCPWARVRRGDMWQMSWSGYDVVYLFQRPESMDRALQKAQAEMRPGAWLVSLEFQAFGWQPHAVVRQTGGKSVWVYRCPPTPAVDAGQARAALRRQGVKRKGDGPHRDPSVSPD